MLLALAICVLNLDVYSQTKRDKVGVVLSGGGATALAHIGFLKALEQNEIPIDYIVGSSMGAIIGAFYASGYTIPEMEAMAKSDEFRIMSQGVLPDSLSFYLFEDNPDASVFSLKFNPEAIVASSLPTHLVDPVLMDYSFVELFGPASAAAGYDFDSLYVPYRALASDIELNESVVFKDGELNLAARASGTFPFYLEPLEIDGKLLFDGGLYNNYPSNVLLEDFNPDVIIGCNVSQVASKPDSENLMSQLVNMIQYQTNFTNITERMITVEPNTAIGTFDFYKIDEAIKSGYLASISKMDSIKLLTETRISDSMRSHIRNSFRSKLKPVTVDQIEVVGLPSAQALGIKRKLLLQKESKITLETFRKRFFRLFADPKIRYIYPTMELNSSGNYVVTVHIKPEKKVEAKFGGNFSSRPLNVGYIGLKYNIPSRNSISLYANSYFGKFYSSAKLGSRMNLNLGVPAVLDVNYTYNSWDYFTSFANFLEQVKPSFIIKNEQFAELNLSLPTSNRGKFEITGKRAQYFDDYYQIDNFTNVDTTDVTNFDAYIGGLTFERNTLNRKQFADKGSLVRLTARQVIGDENTIPGSTSLDRDTISASHNWTVLKGQYQNYFLRNSFMSLGFNLETAWANQPRFSNYRATLIRSLAFEPIPESQSFFIDQYRSNFYSAGGLMLTLDITDNVQFRGESHFYRPWERIFADPDFDPDFDPTTELFFIGSGGFIYHSPLGPLRLTANYYDRKEIPWSIMFNYGFFIFNRSAIN